MSLKNKTILITGASAGLGEAMTRAFVGEGAKVIAVARRKEKLEALTQELGDQSVRPMSCDVSVHDDVRALYEEVTRTTGTPDIIINNAGAGQFLYTEETSIEQAEAMMAVPYFGAFHVTQVFMQDMLERKSGHIVNITSPVCVFAWAGATAYAAARFAMRGFTEALQKDLIGTGLCATLVTPPEISDSDYNQTNPNSFERLPTSAKVLVPAKSVAFCAQKIVRGVHKQKRNIVISWPLKIMYIVAAIFPRSTRFLVEKTGYTHKKLAQKANASKN